MWNQRSFGLVIPIVALALVASSCGQLEGVHDRNAPADGVARASASAPGATSDPRALGVTSPGGASVSLSAPELANSDSAATRDQRVPKTAVGPSAGEIGVTRSSIKIGFIYPKSGPYSAITTNFEPAINAAFNVVNEKGGIHGRKLIPVFGDDAYNNASLALASAKSMEQTSFGIASTVFNTWSAIYQELDTHRVPYIFYNGDRRTSLGLRYAFSAFGFLQTQAELLPGLILSRMNGRNRKIGIMYQETPDLKPVVATFKTKAKAAGLNVVISQPLPETPSTCINEDTKVHDAGAQIVVLIAALGAVCVIRDAEANNWHPTWTGFGWNLDVLQEAMACRAEGSIVPGAWQTLDKPDGQRYQAAMKKYYPNKSDAASDDVAYQQWGIANNWVEAIRRSGPSPTRESFVAGMETMRNWDGGHFPPLTFGPGDRVASRVANIHKVVNCHWVTTDTWHTKY